MPAEPADRAKADGYTRAWGCITGHQGVALGATMFHYGTEYDFGGIWFNLLPAGQKRLSYYAVKKAYGGDTSHDNTPPVISGLTASRATRPSGAGRRRPHPRQSRPPTPTATGSPTGAGQQQLHRQEQGPDTLPNTTDGGRHASR